MPEKKNKNFGWCPLHQRLMLDKVILNFKLKQVMYKLCLEIQVNFYKLIRWFYHLIITGEFYLSKTLNSGEEYLFPIRFSKVEIIVWSFDLMTTPYERGKYPGVSPIKVSFKIAPFSQRVTFNMNFWKIY
jgi:hypothetical protein